jgi:hypothetical protein
MLARLFTSELVLILNRIIKLGGRPKDTGRVEHFPDSTSRPVHFMQIKAHTYTKFLFFLDAQNQLVL